jgi:hypothetical protein
MKIPEQPKQNTPFAPCLMPVLGLIVGIALAHVAPSLLIWTLVLATASAEEEADNAAHGRKSSA